LVNFLYIFIDSLTYLLKRQAQDQRCDQDSQILGIKSKSSPFLLILELFHSHLIIAVDSGGF